MAGKHRGDQAPADYSLELQDRRVRLSEQREARFQRAQAQREERAGQERAASSRSGGSWTPGRVARGVTTRSGAYSGKGTLAALLIVGFVIVAIRLVADAEVADDGTTVKAKVLHPAGELGPIPILAALIATFFVLSFVAIGGGTRAKLAVIMGGAIILTLGVRSLNEFKFVASTFGKIGTITAPAPSGQLDSILGNAGQGGSAPVNAANATSNTVQRMAGHNGIVYVTPTSLSNIGKDLASAAEQSFRQIFPAGTTPLGNQLISRIGNFYKHLFGG